MWSGRIIERNYSADSPCLKDLSDRAKRASYLPFFVSGVNTMFRNETVA